MTSEPTTTQTASQNHLERSQRQLIAHSSVAEPLFTSTGNRPRAGAPGKAIAVADGTFLWSSRRRPRRRHLRRERGALPTRETQGFYARAFRGAARLAPRR